MSITKRLDEARDAYKNKDLSASAAAHKKTIIAKSAGEKHGGVGSQYIGSMVYGGLDGIVTTFAVVSGVAGADLGASVILILGMANLFADGFSMAVGAYLSEKSEKEYYEIERSREAWEVENFPEGERAELIEIYKQGGYSDVEAHDLVAIISKDKERWLDTMMVD
ncbi:MAG: VIT1/CCC1 transporter family protein, partial [Anaerolineaceae bacterium]|nr:VIT1/CCC1 transporter family protein [Anaerolineaceae bacterium]